MSIIDGKLSRIIWNETKTKRLQEKIFLLSSLYYAYNFAISVSITKQGARTFATFWGRALSGQTDIPWSLSFHFWKNTYFPPGVKDVPNGLRHSSQFVIVGCLYQHAFLIFPSVLAVGGVSKTHTLANAAL